MAETEYISLPPQEHYKNYMIYTYSYGSSDYWIEFVYYNINEQAEELKWSGSPKNKYYFYNSKGYDIKHYRLYVVESYKPVCNKKWVLQSSIKYNFYFENNSCMSSEYMRNKLLNSYHNEAYTNIQLGDAEGYINKRLEEKKCNVRIQTPTPTPTPGGGEQTDKTCSNAGQFGGGGTPLKDIKLFLYANKVTKGTIKLSKPQVEVGTFATDWRPNPSDYVERNSPAYKEVKGLAIQHNQSQNKKYLEIETADGYAYGVDLWGGDAKKILEQQQAEIEELKKLVKTLELRINV